MRISVFGTGYVGTVTGACLADLGHEVVCTDIDATKVERLSRGDPIIFEHGLDDVLRQNLAAGRLAFTTDARQAVDHGELIFVCVGTPPLQRGAADLRYVLDVARAVGRHMRGYKVVINKSTVPVGTYERVRRAIAETQAEPVPFDVVSNPEFLREGSAVHDFKHPDRVVLGIGPEGHRARELLTELYAPTVSDRQRQLVVTSIPSAELIKYASNAMLATRISFMNELSHLCEKVGADVTEVAKGMGLDQRIGPRFLEAGCGYGGSCFPKDVKALATLFEDLGLLATLLRGVDQINERQKRSLVHKLKDRLGSLDGATIAVWGLAFKPNTDDIREAPALTAIELLLNEYARVRAYDPEAGDHVRPLFAGPEAAGRVVIGHDPYEVLEGADALLILTEWDAFRRADLGRVRALLKRPLVLDGRNVLDPVAARAAGLDLVGVGRPRS